MSLLLSTGLLAFFLSYGGSQGFFIMLCVFMACIPFFFDGALECVSEFNITESCYAIISVLRPSVWLPIVKSSSTWPVVKLKISKGYKLVYK